MQLEHVWHPGLEIVSVEVPGELLAQLPAGECAPAILTPLVESPSECQFPIFSVSQILQNGATDKCPTFKWVLQQAARAAERAHYEYFTIKS